MTLFRPVSFRATEKGGVVIPLAQGDPHEWNAPWGAVVRLLGGRPRFYFVGTYDPSDEVVRIPCAPGDLIAWGVEHRRDPRRSLWAIGRVGPNGTLQVLQ